MPAFPEKEKPLDAEVKFSPDETLQEESIEEKGGSPEPRTVEKTAVETMDDREPVSAAQVSLG